MCFSFRIDILSKNDYKRKNVTPIKEHMLLAKLKEELQENFNVELEAK